MDKRINWQDIECRYVIGRNTTFPVSFLSENVPCIKIKHYICGDKQTPCERK